MKLILASSSPRRRELLQNMGLELQIVPPECEEIMDAAMEAGELVKKLSSEKAHDVEKRTGSGNFIVAADTVVVIDGKILGKPADEAEAAEMLRKLSGRAHTVFTGVALLKDGTLISDFEQTRVFFGPLSEQKISAYIKSGEPMDKAGAYGAQGLGSVFIEKIDGDFFNVMGLPLCLLAKMFEKMGVSLIEQV